MAKAWPVVAVGAVVWQGPERLLLIQRGQPPKQGEWSLPGGRVEAGESVRQALAREVAEEAAIAIRIERLLDVVDFLEHDNDGKLVAHYVLVDFSAHWESGMLAAGSDANACRWVSPAEALSLVHWDETRRIIRASTQAMWNIDVPELTSS